MKKYEGPEKRKYKRLEANYVISYCIEGISGNYNVSQMKNVGRGGAVFTTNREFAKGAGLIIIVRFPFLPQKVKIKAKIVSSEEISSNLYNTRVKFSKDDVDFLRQLGEFIKKRKEIE
jgi:hypothetical protein